MKDLVVWSDRIVLLCGGIGFFFWFQYLEVSFQSLVVIEPRNVSNWYVCATFRRSRDVVVSSHENTRDCHSLIGPSSDWLSGTAHIQMATS